MVKGSVGDMACLGVTESFQVKRQVLLSAAEAAEMILRVDNVLKAAPRYILHSSCIVTFSAAFELFLQHSIGGVYLIFLHITQSSNFHTPVWFKKLSWFDGPRANNFTQKFVTVLKLLIQCTKKPLAYYLCVFCRKRAPDYGH